MSEYLKKGYLFFYALFILVEGSLAQQNNPFHYLYYQTFGVGNMDGSKLGPSLPGGRTKYVYNSNWCPEKGSYTIARSVPPSGCHNENWLFISSDRTSDYDPFHALGYMMLVNNNNEVTVLYSDTIEGDFCDGTMYNLSISLINLHEKTVDCKPDFPRFYVSLEPLTGQFNYMNFVTAPIGYQDPKKIEFGRYTKDFTLPPGVKKIALYLTTYPNADVQSDCANDFALDDIIIKAIGPEININFFGQPQSTIVSSACFQQNKKIKIEGQAQAFYKKPAYQWEQSIDDGKTWTDIAGATDLEYERVFSVPDTFLFRLRSSEIQNIQSPTCGVVSNTLKVEVDNIPASHRVITNSPVCVGQDLTFTAEPGVRFEWRGPNGFYDNINSPHIFLPSRRDSGWYYADMYTLGGCKVTDSALVKMMGTDAKPDFSHQVECIHTPVEFKNLTIHTDPAILSYRWDFGNAVTSELEMPLPVVYKDTGSYSVSLRISVRGCEAFPTENVRPIKISKPLPGIRYADLTTQEGKPIRLTARAIQGRHFQWSPPMSLDNDTIPSPTFKGTRDTEFQVDITDSNGCITTDVINIKVLKSQDLYIPNVFTPNDDGLHDSFRPISVNGSVIQNMSIFSRQGALIYYSMMLEPEWDGRYKNTPVPAGVYLFIIEYIDKNNQTGTIKGDVTLIR